MSLPNEGFVRLHQIIGNPKANPPIPAVIPVSRSCWYEGMSLGKYPKSLKLGTHTTVWRVEDIRALISGEATK